MVWNTIAGAKGLHVNFAETQWLVETQWLIHELFCVDEFKTLLSLGIAPA